GREALSGPDHVPGTVTGTEKVNIGIGQGLGLEIGHTSTANTADLTTTAVITVMTALGSMTGTTGTTGDQSDIDLSVMQRAARAVAEASGAYVSNFSSGGRIHEDNGGLPLPDAYQAPVDPYQAGNTDMPNQYGLYGSGLQGGKRLDTSSLTPHALSLLKGVVKSSTDATRLMQPCIG
ncbi:MAG: hypothetical protein FRX49_07719, partial [Trebouxia sp. A1-2]